MRYIQRDIDEDLILWKNDPKHKPLIVRGARQVGKSSSIRHLAESFDYFIEVDLEQKKSLHVLFEGDINPEKIFEELSLLFNTPVIAGRTLIFFDEIQACIPAISALRYFYEKTPEIHVIAAGSLLEFALKDLPSFGVGRVRSLFLYPMSFAEFLVARGQNLLKDALFKLDVLENMSDALHQKLIENLIRFMLMGGMPEVVSTYVSNGSLLDCQQILDDITTSLFDDFAKYKSKVPPSRLREVFSSVAQQSGKKFMFSQINQVDSHAQLKQALEILELAGIVHSVTHCAANGLPMAAETNPKFKKYLIFDTGIFQRMCKLNLVDFFTDASLEQINKGSFAEVYAGLEILKALPNNQAQSLYYWHRIKRGSQAEVDYLAQIHGEIIPIEVKSGIKGKMQSLRQFLSEKNKPFGIRTSLEKYGKYDDILVVPLYALAAYITKHND